jgi:hypothetical protein
MVHLEDEEIVPFSPAILWRALQEHTTSEIAHIHPEIIAQKVIRSEGKTTVLERIIKIRGKSLNSTWEVTTVPPSRLEWRVVAGEGPLAPGSFLTLTYEPVPAGTRVHAMGEIKVVGIPFFLQRKAVRMALDQISEQDAAYLKVHP